MLQRPYKHLPPLRKALFTHLELNEEDPEAESDPVGDHVD